MMSRYNRQNPFVYLLETKELELTNKTHECIKGMLLYFVEVIAYFILSIDCGLRNDNLNYTEYLIVALLSAFIVLEVVICVKSNKVQEVNEMIFGDQYKDIAVNNEQMLAKINNYNRSIGKVEYLIETIVLFRLILLVLIGIYLLLLMSKFFI